MWSRLVAAAAPYLVAIVAFVVAAASAASFYAGWSWQQNKCTAALTALERDYEKARATAAIDGKATQDRAIAQVQGVNDARADELVKIAAAAAGRSPTVIRVCNDRAPVRPAVGGQGPDAGNEPSAAARLLQPEDGPGAGAYLSTREFYAIADEADAVSADLRACQSAWPR